MSGYTLSPDAKDDVHQIVAYLSQHSLPSAETFLVRYQRKANSWQDTHESDQTKVTWLPA